MLKEYFIRRALYLIPVLIFISFMSFSLIYIAPGDPAEIMMTSPRVDMMRQLLKRSV